MELSLLGVSTVLTCQILLGPLCNVCNAPFLFNVSACRIPPTAYGPLPYIALMNPDARFNILGHGSRLKVSSQEILNGNSEGMDAGPIQEEGVGGLNAIWTSYTFAYHLSESTIKTKFLALNQVICNECLSGTSTTE